MQLESILTFLYPIIELISKGRPLKNAFAVLFIIIGIIFFGSGVYLLFKFINDVPDIWFTLSLLILVASLLLTFQIWFYRANEIQQAEDTKYFIIHIFENFIRAIGESIALLFVATGIAGIPILWFSRFFQDFYKLISFLPLINIGNTFLLGILFLVINLLIALMMLSFHYLLAECLVVLVDIENNTRKK